MTATLDKIVADLEEMRALEAKGVMVFANSDDTMFEDCIRRLKELSAQSLPAEGVRIVDGGECHATSSKVTLRSDWSGECHTCGAKWDINSRMRCLMNKENK